MRSALRAANGPAGPASPTMAALWRCRRSVVHIRAIFVVAGLAGLHKVVEPRLHCTGVAPGGRGSEDLRSFLRAECLGDKVVVVLPDLRLRPGLADVWPGSGGEQLGDLRGEVVERLRGSADHLQVGRGSAEFAS